MMTRRERFAEALLLPINPALVVLLGLYTIIWGLWIFCPFWDVFDTAPLFSAMAGIASEYVWGSIAIVSGVVICYGAYVRSYGALTRGALVAALHWLVICIMYFMGDPLNTGGITAGLLATYASMVYLNIKINFRSDGRPRHWRMVRK